MNTVIVNVDWDKNYGAYTGNDGVCCVVTGKTLAEVKERMEYSLPLHLASMREDGDKIPKEFCGEYKIKYVLSAQALIRSSQMVVTQAALARTTGINPQLLNHYATGRRHPRPMQRSRILAGMHRLGRELIEVE
ncbi:hypothetical protein FACS1894156_0610 [Bacteroidia bacterium]|nr:hypothetical protein FACS1894156_0610 [Bacteroidia bacterium]